MDYFACNCKWNGSLFLSFSSCHDLWASVYRSIIIYDYFTRKQIGHVSYHAFFLYILQYLVQVYLLRFKKDNYVSITKNDFNFVECIRDLPLSKNILLPQSDIELHFLFTNQALECPLRISTNNQSGKRSNHCLLN